jgi:hypothetical protein
VVEFSEYLTPAFPFSLPATQEYCVIAEKVEISSVSGVTYNEEEEKRSSSSSKDIQQKNSTEKVVVVFVKTFQCRFYMGMGEAFPSFGQMLGKVGKSGPEV